jgi:hypothetical protein
LKIGLLVAVLTVGLLAGLLTGASRAGDAGNAALANPSSVDPEQAVGHTWQTPGPIGTGALSGMSDSGGMNHGTDSGDAGFAQVEIGGVKFRAGIDTGP